MRLRIAELVADAWAMWRADRELLLGVAGPFWFLPSLALAMLVPPPPVLPGNAEPGTREAVLWAEALAQWMADQGGWYVLAAAIGGLGTVTLYVAYLDRTRPDLRDALRLGAATWPRYMLFSAAAGVTAMAGLLLWVVPGLYLLGRLLPAGPALVAERPLGAITAVGRGFAISRGAGWPLLALVTSTLGLGWVAQQPLVALDLWLRGQAGGPNPVALATVDALQAGIATIAALASALLAVAVYRRLVR